MDPDDAWKESIREALRRRDEAEADDGPAADAASAAVAAGTRRLAARSSTHAATAGVVVALGLALACYGWAKAEATWTAETTLVHGAPWTP